MTQSSDLQENDMKFDQDSIPVQLLPTIPMLCIAKGFGYGANKYFANSYRRKDRKAVSWMRTFGSIMRHLMKWAAGIKYDDGPKGSGLPHLWLAGCQLMILIEHTETGMGTDDRHIGGKETKDAIERIHAQKFVDWSNKAEEPTENWDNQNFGESLS